MKPYIGITGFKTKEEVQKLANVAKNLGLSNNTDRTFMLGVISSKRRLINTASEGRRAPSTDSLIELLDVVPKDLLPMMHYHTPLPDTLVDDIAELFGPLYDSGKCRALQLNNGWVNVRRVAKIKNKFPDLDIVLQVNYQDELEYVDETVSRAKKYKDYISYTLIDSSEGAGVEYFGSVADRILVGLQSEMPNVVHGIAGGLSPANVYDKVKSTYESTIAPFNIDAEGRLFVPDKSRLDMDICEKYLLASVAAFKD